MDAVRLSHHQHPDNLDRLGRELLFTVPTVLSTEAAAKRLGGPVHGLANWHRVQLHRADSNTLDVIGVPALHGPEGSESLVGEVTGFVLAGPGLPKIYVSGDNASLDRVREIAKRLGPFDVALLFVGAAQTALVAPAFLTLTGEQTVEAARILGEPEVLALHLEGWAHYTEGAGALRQAFAHAGLEARLHILAPGEWTEPASSGRRSRSGERTRACTPR